METRPLWRCAPPEHTAWARYDDVYVVYHRPSGKTHVVNDATARLLHDVLATPRSIDDAALELARQQPSGPDDGLTEHVRNVIEHLEQIGLVVRS